VTDAQPFHASLGGSAGLVRVVGIVCLALAGTAAINVLVDLLRNDAGTAIVLGIVGVIVLLFGLLCLAGYRNIRNARLDIDADGIAATLRGRSVRIPWSEIGQVGISIISSGVDGPGAPATPVDAGRSVVRIRLAGATPGFAGRRDLAFLATTDEPAPYTHKLPLPTGIALGDGRFGLVEPVAEALRAFGGTRFTGVDQRRGIVGRYS
jgi:hypothetical protein